MENVLDLDQDLWRVRPMGWSPLWLVLFIVLTLGSLVGAYFLYTNLANAQKEADTLVGLVRDHMEMPLRESGVPVSPEGEYGPDFFELVRRYVHKGATIEDYVEKVGWIRKREGDQETREMEQQREGERRGRIVKLTEQTTTLQALIESLMTANSRLQDNIKKLQEDHEQAKGREEAAKVQSEALRKTLQTRLHRLLAEIAKLQTELKRAENRLKVKAADLATARDTVQDKIDTLNKGLSSEKRLQASADKKFKADVAKLERLIKSLKQIKPEQPGPDGRILEVDLATKFAVIDIGQREGVPNGAVYDVIEVTRAGALRTKGQIMVRSVQAKQSHATITKQNNPRNPVIVGDLIKKPKAASGPRDSR